jgi:hypothetical protein
VHPGTVFCRKRRVFAAEDLAAGGISNLYYPASSRRAGLTFENTLIGVGGSAVANLFQEFLVRKLTPHAQGKP